KTHYTLEKFQLETSASDQATIKENMVRFYEAALKNRTSALACEDIDSKAKCLAEGEPQVANVIAYAYADMISAVLRNIDGCDVVYAATSNRRASPTSSIALFTTRDDQDVPTLAEFKKNLVDYDITKNHSNGAYKIDNQLQLMFNDPQRKEAILTAFDPKWDSVPNLQVVDQRGKLA
ncbi:MAG: hypothetical protein K2X09_04910, partial [Rickettsiales bacterium]|nr:hypothetical protein [Rickettsiales bacterium]